jgi:hypothetical protein
MVCIRSTKQAFPDSRHLSAFTSLQPEALHTEAGLKVIRDFLNDFKASGILSINEEHTCWLNDHLPSGDCLVPVWAPPKSTIRSLLSKQKQLEVAQNVGFDILPTYLIDRRRETIESVPEMDFPLCLRPDNPDAVRPAFKVQLVDSRNELIRYVSQLEKLDKPLLGQRFADLPNLVVHGARTTSGNAIGLQAFIVENKFQGVSLTIRSVDLEEPLRRHCIKFVDAFGLTGNYHFEFLWDRPRDKVYFLEINGRLGGTTAKVLALGYDEPILALESYGVCESRPQAIRNSIVSSKHALMKHAIYAMKGRLTRMDFPISSNSAKFLKSLYGLFRYKDEILTVSDIKGTMAFYRTLFDSHA